MKVKIILSIKVLLFSISVSAQTYITNVSIADVENKKIIPNQTVVIDKDLISKIQSSKVKIPANATIIDGTGKFLFPGLTDAHIHFFQNGGLYARPDAIDLRKYMPYDKEIELLKQTMEDKLRRYLQNGITNVIDVGANTNLLKQRNTFKDADYAPSIYMTGPLLTTYEPKVYENLNGDEPFILTKTIEDGIKGVQAQLPFKPDFIKIWYIAAADGLGIEASARKNLPIIKAIIDEAHKNNLKVAVHATERITAQLAVENGADFLVHSVDDEILKDDFIQLLKKNKVILCPTLIVEEGYMNTFGQKVNPSTFEISKANPFQLGSLLDLKHLSDTLLINKYKNRANSASSIESTKKSVSTCMQNLKRLSDAGVLITTGTDAGNIGTMHASSYLTELQAMQKSGMNTWQIIQASTINGAKILNKEKEFGTISAGKKANLILLNANPIDNLDNITKIDKVINKGVVFSPEKIVEETPTELVQRQLNAYNYRNIDAFLDTYADDVEVYDYPNTLQFKGKEEMRKIYATMFDNTPNLHCELVGRITQGNIVIDKEHVQFGKKSIEGTAIYHVENGKIKKVYFIL
ncbi:amidohydrolase family protein [Flavobacterium capsici]|uniref:Amidohydrolase family protein n=1 Tax=Flavobacterium capsici TaxID=3075618 RepID=A0AA96J527_9FLAO|nr:MULTISPECIES: amidohydrolase family protein [unclassified Flavobacterium]WNM18676.1 amidohydrolase family protein [Flavobacterium sp. PMR2A8]WNM22727.1 amidohydrolase family protein [Flavobacterium sp. PMTSA4]